MKEPYSESAEMAVLGGILIDDKAIAKVKALLEPGDFFHNGHKHIYSAMLDVYEDGKPVDVITVGDRLKEQNKLGIAGGLSYLSEMGDNTGSSANIEHHAKIVKEKATLREYVAKANEIAKQAMEPGVKPEDLPTRLSISLPQPVQVNQASAVIKQLNQNIKAGYPGIYPGYDVLARTIRKIVPGHLWIIGGYTSTGKSAVLVDLICRLYRKTMDNPGIAIFSTEMSAEQYLVRCLSNLTKIPGWAITENKVKTDQAAELVKAQVFLSERNLYIYDRLYRIEDIERTARNLKENMELDIIAIDYLQNLWGDGSIYERMSKLAPVLQYLAKELDVTIIALSQVSNQHQREKGAGGVYGFKGAGEIAASADLAIELERDPVVKEKLYFKVSKNRHGRPGEGVLEYVHGFVRFKEIVDEGADREGM